jgi:protein-disulfide isomerase
MTNEEPDSEITPPEEEGEGQTEGPIEEQGMDPDQQPSEILSEEQVELPVEEQGEDAVEEQAEDQTEDQAEKPRKKFHFPWVVVLVVLLPVFFALGVGLGYWIWGTKYIKMTRIEVPEQVTRYDVSVDDDPAIGPEDAPITLIEFADYECPYCKTWHDEVEMKLRQKYSKKIRFVYRDFPLGSHENALSAAEAANCAGDQGKYWEYHDLLYEAKEGLGDEAYQKYAEQLDLDLVAFQVCQHRYQEEIMADYEYASSIGVSSTPTFFLNGIPFVGGQSYDFFKQIVDLELKGKIPKE